MKIHFVTESGRWILGRWCDEWAKRIPGATVGTKAEPHAANVYVNYFLYGEETALDICYFTHRELHDKNMQNSFNRAAKECDWCLAQCDITAGLLPSEKTTIVKPGVGSQFVRSPLRLGVASKPQAWNRKRLDVLQPLTERSDVEVVVAGGGIPYGDMDRWYKGVDYVLITSENEGGPMSVLEAVAMRKPFIAPRNVGWCSEYPGLLYDSYEEMYEIIDGLVYDPGMWDKGAQQIVKVVEELI